MSSESNFEPSSSPPPQSSSEAQSSEDEAPRSARQDAGETLISPKKRRRSPSRLVDLFRNSKRHQLSEYNDNYRILFNEVVRDAVRRFDPVTARLPASQIGASKWSTDEKAMLFSAIERLGRDDLPGLASAIQTKSMPEIRDFLLLLHDASLEQGDAIIDPRDIPAAAELSPECSDLLDRHGDTLAWYQEVSEAEVEQDRYGPYWLITTELAEEIETAISKPNRRSSSPISSPPFQPKSGKSSDEIKDNHTSPEQSISRASELLEAVAPSELLKPSAFLSLSMNLFMNSSSNSPSANPHWSELDTELASGPSIYHTTLIDFRTLAVSVTERLVQASIFQATSRLRAHTWRSNEHIAKPFVKKRDVQAAIDILGLERDKCRRLAGAARRCGVRVVDGTGKTKRELGYDEVEELLSLPKRSRSRSITDAETDGEGGFTTDGEEFPRRAVRAATPRPSADVADAEGEEDGEVDSAEEQSEQVEEAIEEPSEEDDSDSAFESSASEPEDDWEDLPSAPESDRSSKRRSRLPLSELAINQLLETHDAQISFEEESRICARLGWPAPSRVVPESKRKRDFIPAEPRTEADNWRDWTEYRAEWEVFGEPVPEEAFQANREGLKKDKGSVQTGFDDDAEVRAKAVQREIPTRSGRAYAKLLEQKALESEDVDDGEDGEDVRPSVEEGVGSLTVDEDEDVEMGMEDHY